MLQCQGRFWTSEKMIVTDKWSRTFGIGYMVQCISSGIKGNSKIGRDGCNPLMARLKTNLLCVTGQLGL